MFYRTVGPVVARLSLTVDPQLRAPPLLLVGVMRRQVRGSAVSARLPPRQPVALRGRM